MGKPSNYKAPGQTVVTVPLDPALHRKIRVEAAMRGISIKSLLTEIIERALY